jgi:hypothetical protein
VLGERAREVVDLARVDRKAGSSAVATPAEQVV